MQKSRRDFLQRWAGFAAAAAAPGWVHAAMLTPCQTAGPFYPPQLPLDNDNDLVHAAGSNTVAKGTITDLSGRLLDPNGNPLQGIRIEIWQCDANGRYRHPRDSGRQPVDPGFHGIGHTLTDGEGRYRFLTIKPVPYPGRTPHIHVAVYPKSEQPFITQLYVAGEPRNARDFLYDQVPAEKRHLVTAEFVRAAAALPDAELQARWDIVLGVPGTGG
ncbi:MAG TPA: intradiol ring-cleavage dioxygenase [Gammaproteobacteria bacterium]|nr:intradiol ring-cleavage dioxygenase [Gammaproteobacteria bacterium]